MGISNNYLKPGEEQEEEVAQKAGPEAALSSAETRQERGGHERDAGLGEVLGEQGRVYNPGTNFSLFGFRMFSMGGGEHFRNTLCHGFL